MPTTAVTGHPAAATRLSPSERRVLAAVGCGLRDDEIATALALSEESVAEHLAGVLVKLGLRDRDAAIVHAFDCGLVVPGRGVRTPAHRPPPQAPAPPTAAGRLRVSLLGPLRVRQDGRRLDAGHLRQQAVLAVLALGAGRSFSRRELLDGVWGAEPPTGNVVPVYVYRLRKALCTAGGPDPVIEHGARGYRLASEAVDVDVARFEQLSAAVAQAERAGEPRAVVSLCAQALGLFRGEPLAGLPGPFAEGERLRLTERRIALTQGKLEAQLRLGQHAEATAELFALTAAYPLHEPLAALLIRALHRNGRQAEALTVFERARRRLADDLGVAPGPVLRRAQRTVLRARP
ncbi:BTAD domain-containing putative transcriptional regulator [Streptomyces sp. NPDC018007]|uniref:BTAD domain-containing putative transcriptional regulator n=1 Tax=unclassified Streptomyces TaxID=2593676 RepID=UPI00378A28E1|nr:winged helix-turn-helix domain-containing protein [Streptomyces sp. NBC_01178]